MQELKAGVTDAAVEKHVPVYTVEGSHVHVVVEIPACGCWASEIWSFTRIIM